jgi:hypothetical protein
MRGAPHQHDRLDRKGEARRMHLRHIGKAARAFADRIGGKRAALDERLARKRLENPEQRLQERGLAAAVRPKERKHLTLRERYVEPAPDHAIAIADR